MRIIFELIVLCRLASGENCVMRSLMSLLFSQYYSRDKIENNEMDGYCSTYVDNRSLYRVLVGKPEGRDHLRDQGVDGKIILKMIFKKWYVGVWIGSHSLRIGTGECGNKRTGSIKCGEFRAWLKSG